MPSITLRATGRLLFHRVLRLLQVGFLGLGVVAVAATGDPPPVWNSFTSLLTTVTLTAPDALATESPLSTGSFRVTRTGPTTAPLTVRFSRGGSATAGSDYVSFPLSLTIPAGAISADIRVTPINDALIEASETVILTLAASPPYRIGSPRSATVTLTSEDKPVVTFTAPDPLATESPLGTGTFRITRTGATSGPLTVFFARTGTATAGSDYVNFPLSLTIPAGSNSVDLLVTPVNDSLIEGPETVVLILGANAAYKVGTPSTATVTMVSEDFPAPSPVAPTGLIGTATPTYTWQAVAGASEYSLWVEDSTGVRLQQWYAAAQVGCESGTGNCQLTPDLPLEMGDAKWWVRARNAEGEGPQSAQIEFAVAPLFPPVLLVPVGAISTTTPTYTWQAVVTATEYSLWVQDSTGIRLQQWYPAAQTGCASTGLCQLTPDLPLAAGTAKWWVKARHAGGEGPLSSQGDFMVDPLLASRQWSTWSKWAQPVFTGVQGAADPSIVRDGALYRMAYTCSDPDSPRSVLCMVESQDGFTWQNIPVEGPIDGLILRGTPGEWDENLETSHLSNQGGEYRLLYSGYRDQGTPIPGFPGFLGLAPSIDGRSFSRASPTPILQPTPGWYDNDAIFSPTVLSTNGTLVMIYAGHCYTNCTSEPGVRLLAATSTDGTTWTKEVEPVLSRSTEIEWMRDGVAEADLTQGPDGAFYLFFTGLRDDQRVIGVARGASPFGPWEINPDPIVRPTPGSFDEAGVLAPEIIIEQGKARMWYLGLAAGEFPFIGYAESVWPLFAPAP